MNYYPAEIMQQKAFFDLILGLGSFFIIYSYTDKQVLSIKKSSIFHLKEITTIFLVSLFFLQTLSINGQK